MAVLLSGLRRVSGKTSEGFCKLYCKVTHVSADEEFVEKNFTKLMRNVPQPVVVVTTSQYKKESDSWLKRGITCSSFTNISRLPPIISFAIKRPSRMHDLLEKTRQFAVHVLAQNQVSYGRHFASFAFDDRDQFEYISHELDEQGIPILHNTCGVMRCKAHFVSAIGDHNVWFGEVVDIKDGSEKQPLLYYMRSFRSVGDEMFMDAFEKRTLPFEEWTHEAHLRMSWNYIREHGRENALPYIKSGIQRYNEQNKDKVARGYHETVTTFYIAMVANAIQRFDGPNVTFEEFIIHNQHLKDTSLLWQYYSKERINDKEAAHTFLNPDRQELPG